MASYVKFELSDGTSVFIESTDAPRGNSGLIPRASEAANESGHPFGNAVAPLSQMAQAMLAGFRSAEGEPPSEVQVSFSLKANPELGGGLVVSRTGSESNFNVTLRWHKDKPEKDADAKE